MSWRHPGERRRGDVPEDPEEPDPDGDRPARPPRRVPQPRRLTPSDPRDPHRKPRDDEHREKEHGHRIEAEGGANVGMQQGMKGSQCSASWAVQARDRVERTHGERRRAARVGEMEQDGQHHAADEERGVSQPRAPETDGVIEVHGRSS